MRKESWILDPADRIILSGPELEMSSLEAHAYVTFPPTASDKVIRCLLPPLSNRSVH